MIKLIAKLCRGTENQEVIGYRVLEPNFKTLDVNLSDFARLIQDQCMSLTTLFAHFLQLPLIALHTQKVIKNDCVFLIEKQDTHVLLVDAQGKPTIKPLSEYYDLTHIIDYTTEASTNLEKSDKQLRMLHKEVLNIGHNRWLVSGFINGVLGYGIVDRFNHWITRPMYSEYGVHQEMNLIIVQQPDPHKKGSFLYGVVDFNGNEVVPMAYKHVSISNECIFCINNRGKTKTIGYNDHKLLYKNASVNIETEKRLAS